MFNSRWLQLFPSRCYVCWPSAVVGGLTQDATDPEVFDISARAKNETESAMLLGKLWQAQSEFSRDHQFLRQKNPLMWGLLGSSIHVFMDTYNLSTNMGNRSQIHLYTAGDFVIVLHLWIAVTVGLWETQMMSVRKKWWSMDLPQNCWCSCIQTPVIPRGLSGSFKPATAIDHDSSLLIRNSWLILTIHYRPFTSINHSSIINC